MSKRAWSQYNQELVQRGNITLYIDKKCLRPSPRSKKTGRPQEFSDALILMLVTIKIQYNLTYRKLEGFAKSIFSKFFPELKLPTYSLICKRAAKLANQLPKLTSRRPLTIMLDATGMKIVGEGEWKVRTHGKDCVEKAYFLDNPHLAGSTDFPSPTFFKPFSYAFDSSFGISYAFQPFENRFFSNTYRDHTIASYERMLIRQELYENSLLSYPNGVYLPGPNHTPAVLRLHGFCCCSPG